MLTASGPLLSVDVGEREATTTSVDDLLEEYLGGRALGTKLAHDRIPFDADPLGPENRVVFTTGPLQLSQMSFTGRMSLTGLSPLTDGLFTSNAGGYLSRNFAGTGNAVVEVTGQSDVLLGIHVTDDGVEFEEVQDLEGATVSRVSEYVSDRRDLNSENLATIGPAGENEVRFASVMTFDSRAFGRGGFGAVLGAKNVKFLSFDGESAPSIDSNEKHTQVHRTAATADDPMKEMGTNAATEFKSDHFSLPTRYFSETSFEHAAAIGNEGVAEKKYKKGACSMCAFACKLPTRDDETGLETEGPEFETSFALGSNCGVGDIVDVMKSNDLCDEYGLDTISAGDTVAAYLASEDEFGNADLVHDLLEKIAHREGVGDRLAEGIDRLHDDLDVDNWTVKGLEFPGHDGRVMHPVALSYAVANAGADHMYGRVHQLTYNGDVPNDSLDGAAAVVVRRENRAAARDSAILCAFGDKDKYVDLADLGDLLETDAETLANLGDRVITLERHFNNRRGMDRDDDRLPYEIPDLEEAIGDYYAARGWREDGIVPESRVP
ncbi:MAG: aldehyde ferredoxin oxidoreductase C-terminal domain-containing protein [Halanaeroarchaeum sp.]